MTRVQPAPTAHTEVLAPFRQRVFAAEGARGRYSMLWTVVFCFPLLCKSSPLYFLVSGVLHNFKQSKINGHSVLLSSTNVFFFKYHNYVISKRFGVGRNFAVCTISAILIQSPNLLEGPWVLMCQYVWDLLETTDEHTEGY